MDGEENITEMQPALLLAAHPGHELRLFHWMELARPAVCLLTDGSGAASKSRTALSTMCCATAGARPGPVFGALPDRAWYAALLAGDAAPFLGAGDAILADAIWEPPVLVVSDAVEGYNPMHDLASALAAGIARRLGVPHFVYSPTGGAVGVPAAALALDLPAQARKRASALEYTALAEEVDQSLTAGGAAWTIETLLRQDFAWPSDWVPDYERVGRERVASGRYAITITYRDHVLPLARRLLRR